MRLAKKIPRIPYQSKAKGMPAEENTDWMDV
jgi:hypothetical protein